LNEFESTGSSLGADSHIGLDDAVWISRGVTAPSNAAMAEKAMRIFDHLGAEALTARETRKALGL